MFDHLHAGFVGRWAEWHSSYQQHVLPGTLTLGSSGKILVEHLLNAFSKKRQIAFRYPTFQQQVWGNKELSESTAFNESNQSRSGFYNDGFAYDETDFGTWNIDFPNPDPVREYAKRFTKYTVMSGEPAGPLSYTASQIMKQFSDYHFTSLSMNMPDAVNQRFYTSIKNLGLYQAYQ